MSVIELRAMPRRPPVTAVLQTSRPFRARTPCSSPEEKGRIASLPGGAQPTSWRSFVCTQSTGTPAKVVPGAFPE